MHPSRILKTLRDHLLTSIRETIYVMRHKGLGQVQFWLVALIVGVLAGTATGLFRMGIIQIETLVYGVDDQGLATAVKAMPWYWVLTIPIVGGLIVGVILQRFTPDGRARGVAQAIKGAALQDGRVEGKAGLASAFASLITLSMGGSAGREGPVVHLGAVISSKVSRWINADAITGRNLMGCAAAAAVSASFNAPIAGTLFALEVVLRHYAVNAFAPIVIASVAGSIISRLMFGDLIEFTLPQMSLQFYGELPAFLILGLVSGLVAVAMMKAVFLAEDVGDSIQGRLKIPAWLRPAIAGAALGGIALYFPHIIGVGYETTWNALSGNITLWAAIIFAATKVLAVAVTFAGRMGGGIFSPSLMVGALTGMAFGWIAMGIFPSFESYAILYALAGMAAVSAAVLGAPISTSLLVFEMTGDWQTGLAVLVAVSTSTALASRLVHKSFFLTQLERFGVHIAAGPQAYLLATFSVSSLMCDCEGEDEICQAMITQDVFVDRHGTLESAMPLFARHETQILPVIGYEADQSTRVLLGVLHEVDALRAFNQALVETAREEHS
jgi:chloride channel protein, CIC family